MINRLMEKKRQGEEGFTLIEMLIVVIILGILAAVVVFGVSTFREDSVSSSCKTDVKSVEAAAQAYRAKTGSFAASTAVLKNTGYLRSEPSSTEYTITYTVTAAAAGPPATPETFTVSGDLDGGATTTDCSA